MDAIEDQCFLFLDFFLWLHELTGCLRVMHGQPEMMHGMITIVPAHFIITGINAINGAGKIILRAVLVNKRMLRTVTQHHKYTGKEKRNDENKKSGF